MKLFYEITTLRIVIAHVCIYPQVGILLILYQITHSYTEVYILVYNYMAEY